jgi:hypothetical protein
VLTAGTGITTSGTYPSFTVTNSAPDQVVSLTGAGTTTISGTYPSFTVTSNDQFVGTVTSVNLTASTGISVSGGPITSSGSITVTNTAPDQTVVLTAGTGISTSGTYPSFTVTNSAPDQTVVLTASTGITTSGTYPNFTIANSAPDQTVVLTAGTGITTSGTYPSFTVTNSAPDQTVVLTAGTGITTSGTYPSFTVTNDDRGSSQNIFKNIAVAGQSDIVADTNNDTLTVAAGTGISITTNATTDTLTITNTAAFSIPVFAGYSSGGVTLATDATVYDFKIDTETIIDTSTYSHSTSVDAEEITVLSDGTYEITYSGVLFNANANSSAAAVVDFKVFKNGAVLDDPLNTAQNVAHLNTSNYNYINQISNSYIVELLNNDIIKLTISAAYQGGGSPSPAVKFGFQGSAKNNLTIKKIS